VNGILTVDVDQTRLPLKEFFSDGENRIWFFHDSFEILPKLAVAGKLTSSVFVYLSSSWYIGEYRARRYAEVIAVCQGIVGDGFRVARQIVFMANAQDELLLLRRFLPTDAEVILVNNTCFLDETTFRITIPVAEKKWSCVVNAKPMAFKRHFLTSKVQSKIFITYDNSEQDEGNAKRVSLEALSPSAIFSYLPETSVVSRLNECYVGVMLSEEEGACYANTEYLLCGLPVVSTLSLGGRDEFYDDVTAIVCDANELAVADAVSLLEKRVKCGAICPDVVRQRTLARIGRFRENLVESIKEKQIRLCIEADLGEHFYSKLSRNSKFKDSRNFFLVDIEVF